MPSAKVLTTSDDAFKADVLESSVTVLVDFWAPWCGPCRMIAPIMDDLAEEFDGKLKVVKVNIDDCAKVAAEYGIRSIPTLLIFKGGQVVLTITGAQPKSAIYQKVTPLI